MAQLSEEQRLDALKRFKSRLRRVCLDLGGKAALIADMDARELLGYYAELIERSEADAKAIKRLMEQAPGPSAA